MKVLLAENSQSYTTLVSDYQRALQPLQTALNAYKALGIATVPTVAELADLQDSPRSFLVKMMTNRQPLSLAGGITVLADKFYDLLDKPAGGEKFVAQVTTLFAQQSGYTSNRVDVSSIDLVNGQVQLKQSVKDDLLERSRTYATTQAQKDEWDQLQIIAVALNTIRQYPRMSDRFETDHYLRKMLLREGYAAGSNAIEVNAQAVIQFA